MTQEFTPEVWVLHHIADMMDDYFINRSFIGVFMTLESAQQHMKEYCQAHFEASFKDRIDNWDCISPGLYETETYHDRKFTLERVPLGGVDVSPMTQFVWDALHCSPAALDAIQDVLARGG